MATEIEISFDTWDGDLSTIMEQAQPKRTAAILAQLRSGAYNVEEISEEGHTPLHCAAEVGNYYIGYVLVTEFKQAPDTYMTHGLQPLHLAAMHGHTLFAKMLLDLGANVDTTSKQHIRPLHLACSSIYPDMVKLLLEHGADAHNTTRLEKQTPLHCAAQAHGRRMLMAEKKVCGELFLSMLKDYWQSDIVKIVILLLNHQASITAIDKFGKTPLHYAQLNGLTRVADLLCPAEVQPIPQKIATISHATPPAGTPTSSLQQAAVVKPKARRVTFADDIDSRMGTIIEGIEALLDNE